VTISDFDDDLPMRGRLPTHDVYVEDTNRDGSDRRRKIGVGFTHLDGGGLSLIVDCVPLTGEICIREKHFSKKELH
jgi:hypothetical protein